MHYAADPPHGASHPHATTTCRRDGYEPRPPEDGELYQTIAAHWPAFDEEVGAHGGALVLVMQHDRTVNRCQAWLA